MAEQWRHMNTLYYWCVSYGMKLQTKPKAEDQNRNIIELGRVKRSESRLLAEVTRSVEKNIQNNFQPGKWNVNFVLEALQSKGASSLELDLNPHICYSGVNALTITLSRDPDAVILFSPTYLGGSLPVKSVPTHPPLENLSLWNGLSLF